MNKKSNLCHILIADDRSERRIDTSLLLSRSLREIGISCEMALRENGQEVYKDISVLKNIYDVLVLDYGMPKLDGVSLVKRLRRQGYQGHIIMLTGHFTGVCSSELYPIKSEAEKENHVYWVDSIFNIFDGNDRAKLAEIIKTICCKTQVKV